MCESAHSKTGGWQGWIDVPPPRVGRAVGDWVDLSHRVTEDLARGHNFPRPRIARLLSQPRDPVNVTEIHMVAHHGTHIDAPRHFFADGPTVDEIPLDRLHGPAVVWHIEKERFGAIEPSDLEGASPELRPGDMLLLDTGWARHIADPAYGEHPHLTEAAAQWLVERRVKLVGVDAGTPDVSSLRRPPGFNWPVHHVLLSRGVLIAEHLTNLSSLRGQRVEAMFLGLNLAGSDGSPARVVARRVAD